MPDLLGVTNAVPGNDSNLINRNMPSIPNDPRLQNAPDPTRVTRSDNRSERQDTGDPSGSRALRYDSNFLTFLQRMSDTPGLARTMTELLRTFQGTVVSSGAAAPTVPGKVRRGCVLVRARAGVSRLRGREGGKLES